ncbi:MAG TPA: hypothetical protein VE344_11790 [Methylomirabilota bacterium]|nr:hypothetical protein [Methylomirabilota bacterium]
MKINQFAWLTSVMMLMILSPSFKATAQTVQYVTLNSTANGNGVNLAVQTNQIVSLVGYDWIEQPILSANLPDGTSINLISFYTSLVKNQVTSPYSGISQSSSTIGSQIPQIFTGVTNIIVQPSIQSSGFLKSGWATFQITTPACATVVSNYVPADAIVIPASATGNVQIILESSPDLVNWTAASPGTYGASAGTNRFFRVRAVAN